MSSILLTTYCTPCPLTTLPSRVNSYAALSPLRLAKTQIEKSPSRQDLDKVETEHSTWAEKVICWIHIYNCEERPSKVLQQQVQLLHQAVARIVEDGDILLKPLAKLHPNSPVITQKIWQHLRPLLNQENTPGISTV